MQTTTSTNTGQIAPVCAISLPKPSEQQPLHPIGEHALRMAKAGFRVFPLPVDDKKKSVQELKGSFLKWTEQATTDEAKIRRWWSKANYNYGVAFDEDTVVIDYDVGDGKLTREQAVALLYEHFGQLPENATPVVGTQGGGLHVYCRVPTGVRISNLKSRVAKYVDVKSYGGYVLGPGSAIHGRPYRLLHGDFKNITSISPELLKLIKSTASETRDKKHENGLPLVSEDEYSVQAAERYIREDAPNAEYGARNNIAYKVACKVKNLGAGEHTGASLMYEWNATKVFPPLDDDELDRTIASAYKNSRLPQGADDPRAEFEPVAIAASDGVAPVDLWEDDNFPPDLSAGILPSPLERWVEDEAKRKGVARGVVAVPAVVMCAAALSAQFTIQVKQNDTGHTDRAILWGAIVGLPGTRKSPVLKEILSPLEALDKSLDHDNKKLWAEYEIELARWKQTGKRAGQPEPKRPRQRRKIVTDVTTEALAELLVDNPTGLLCFHDELAAWAGSMDAYRQNKGLSKDQPFWLSAKSGGVYRVDRKTSRPLSVECNAVHVLGGIQPDVLRTYAPDWGGNGLLQRFLLVNMERSAPAPDLPVDEVAKGIIRDAVIRVSRLEWSEFSEPFRFSAEANEYRKRIVEFAACEIADINTPMPLAGWLDKLEGEWARLATVFHILDWATRLGTAETTDAPSTVIDADCAKRAARFLLEFQYPHQAYFYRTVAGLGAAGDEDARKIAGHILAHGLTEITDRTIYRSFPSLRKVEKHRDARLSAMRTLELSGWVKSIGDRGNKWRVIDAVHDGRFNQRAEAERIKRESIRQKIARDAAARREVTN